MSETKVASEDHESTPKRSRVPTRWREGIPGRDGRRRTLVVSTCILACVVGALVAVASLPAPRPETVLVSLYLPPPDADARGVDAPHPGSQTRLFGLNPINEASRMRVRETRSSGSVPGHRQGDGGNGSGIERAPASESAQREAHRGRNNASPSSAASSGRQIDASGTGGRNTDAANRSHEDHGPTEASGTDADEARGVSAPATHAGPIPAVDWRDAVRRCDGSEQLVLHVSSLAKVNRGQVVFYGRGPHPSLHQTTTLAEVLAAIDRCPAREKLLVLEVHWPIASDGGDLPRRLNALNRAIQGELRQYGEDTCHVLLSSRDRGPARGLPLRRETLMCRMLTAALGGVETDRDRDGRITLREAFRWAKPRIHAASSEIGPPQEIVHFGPDREFALTPRDSHKPAEVCRYPAWLEEGWRLRSRYLSDSRLPWVPGLAARWGENLHDLESRLRRGEEATAVKSAITALNEDCTAAIQEELAKLRSARPDSLRIAACRFPADPASDARTSAREFWDRLTELGQTEPEERAATVSKLVAEYAKAFKSDPAVGLEALLSELDENPRVTHDHLSAVNQVLQCWKRPPRFPITEAIARLVRAADAARHVDASFQILRLQGRLGLDRDATSLISRRAAAASRKLATVQRLLWNPGMTSSEEITDRADRSIATAASVAAAEEMIGEALRLIRTIEATAIADAAGGVNLPGADDEAEIRRRFAKVVNMLRQVKKADTECRGILAGELAMLRQSSEAARRSWERAVDRLREHCLAEPAAPNQGLSTILSAETRARSIGRQAAPESTAGISGDVLKRAGTLVGSRGSPDAERSMISPKIAKDLRELTRNCQKDYSSWLATFVASTRDVAAISAYEALARRHESGAAQRRIPVSVDDNLQRLSWNTPEASIKLHYRVDLPDAEPVNFELLPPAAASLRADPGHGALKPDEKANITLRLLHDGDATRYRTLRGVWLKLARGGQTQLVPVRMPARAAVPDIEVEFSGDSVAQGRDIVLRRWPSREPQPLRWTIHANDPAIKAVIASVTSSDGTSLTSAPIPLMADASAPIAFPPGKAAAKGKHSAAVSLVGPLKLEVSDAKTGDSLGQWRVKAQLNDPRRIVSLGWSEYRVRPDGSNQLTVAIRREPSSSRQYDDAALNFEIRPDRIPSLIDLGPSRLKAPLDKSGHVTRLRADNLRFREGGETIRSLPIYFNGEPGYFQLSARFPRRAGVVQLEPDQTPVLKIAAANAVVPGAPLPVTIHARNLTQNEPLVIELLGSESDSKSAAGRAVLWSQRLPSPRKAKALYRPGSSGTTLSVVATERDWTVRVPTDIGTGPHFIRVSTVNRVGADHVTAQHRVLLDDSVPDRIRASGRADGDRVTVDVSLRPGPSGVTSLSVTEAALARDAKTQPISAEASGESGKRWQLRWPKGRVVPDRIQVHLTTGAGKSLSTSCELPVRKTRPRGTVMGNVREGSIAQPGLAVHLSRPDGKPVASVRSGADGSYRFAISPGDYAVYAEKPATGRRAAANVTIEKGDTRRVDLSLTRTPTP